jgi:hypothetical protein
VRAGYRVVRSYPALESMFPRQAGPRCMSENSQRRHKPQYSSAFNARSLPEQESVSGAFVAVEGADAATFAGQVDELAEGPTLPLDSSNWLTTGYVYQSLCKLPRYVGYSGLALADLYAKVRSGDVPAMRQCFLYDCNRKLPGPARERLKRSHWRAHRFLGQPDGRLEVIEGPFHSAVRPVIYGPVRGYAYFVWKPAVAKHWPGVFASTPLPPALTNPVDGKQAPGGKQAPQRRRGPVTTHDWCSIWGEIACRCIDPKSQRLRIPKSERKLARDMLTWCQTTYGQEPAESEMREAVKGVCAALRRGGSK